MAKRTDPHRPGAIIPADYEYCFSYNTGTSVDGWPLPSFGVNCELDRRCTTRDPDGKEHTVNGQHDPDGRCCVIGLLHVAKVQFAATGGTGNCSICGAAFVYGDVWEHRTTGEHIHLGHTCADKYNLLANRSAYELSLGNLKAAAARECAKAKNAEERAAFLKDHPGLAEDLAIDHPIIRDIAARFQQYRSLSDKQIGLVQRIAAEAKRPPEEQEKTIPAPTGKVTFTGTVVSAKTHESDYGPSYKMTVKVKTDAGVWLAWGTVPAAVLDACPYGTVGRLQNLRGAEVQITATLKPGRDAHFAVTSRPSGKLLKLSPTAPDAPKEQVASST